jgi:peroxiredoxin Q/BCP
LGFEDVAVTRRFDSFDGTSKVHIARKFGVIGVNVIARAPAKVLPDEDVPRDSWIDRIRKAARRLGGKRVDTTVGAEAPDFELPTNTGTGSLRLGAQRGHHVLLMFLPADWCPVCQACLRVYKDNAPLMRGHGVQVLIVTTEVTPEVRAFARGVELAHDIVIDADCSVAQRFGAARVLEKTKGLSMLPISFFIDSAGVVKRRSELDTMELCVSEFSELLSEPTG